MWRRVFGAELKRLLKTRSVLILMAAAVVLAPVLAYFPASFASYTYRDDSGREVTAEGREALLLERENQGEFQGEITEEVLTAALKRYQDFADGYEGGLPDGIYDERVEASDYYEKVSNVDGLLNRVNEAYADPRTGIAPGLDALTEEETEGFYGQCRQHLRELLYLEGGEGERTVNAVRQAEALYDQVKMPFTYEPGVTADALEYVGIYVFLLVMIGTFLLVPVFASDRQTQADQILKCTREGKACLAVSRILAGLLIVTILYVVCMTLFLALLNASFDFKGLDTSLQLLVSVAVFLPVTVGQMELLIAGAGLVSLLAVAGFTLFLSGRMKSVAAASVTAFVFLVLPVIFYMMLGNNLGNWIRCLLPAGGVGMVNSFTYAALNTDFASSSSFSFFTAALWLSSNIFGSFVIGIWIPRSSFSLTAGSAPAAIWYATVSSGAFPGTAITGQFLMILHAFIVMSSGSPGPTPTPYNLPAMLYLLLFCNIASA